MKRHYRPNENSRFLLNVTPETAEWKYISFKVAQLVPGQTIEIDTAMEEVLIVLESAMNAAVGCWVTTT